MTPLFLLLACTGADPEPAPEDGGLLSFPEERPQNLLVVSLDTVRRDRVGRYGGGDTTPVLDALLTRSVVLDQHRACSNWTYPALVCLYTGASPTDVGFMPRGPEPATPDLQTMAEGLADAGFDTRLAGAQLLLDPELGLVQGFGTVSVDADWSAEQVTEQALALAEDLASPWLLQAHYLDPHLPYLAPAEHERRPADLASTIFDLTDPEIVHDIVEHWGELSEEERDALLANIDVLYEAELRYTDAQVGALLDGLDAGGLLDDTLVLLVTDHGEQFYEHGQFEHGSGLYGEETWAVAALAAPGLAPASWTGLTHHGDLLPSVLSALALPASGQATGTVVGTAPEDRPAFTAFSLRGRTVQGVEVGRDRLLFDWGPGTFERFELGDDPGELEDLHDAAGSLDQELVAHLWPEVERLAEVLGQEVPARGP